MNRLLISAAHKSSGKTTITLGLCAALSSRGRIVQPFKKGPDYIDPMWLGRAATRPCHNLDFYSMGHQEILNLAGQYAAGADISLIEGNKGLYDGLDLDGSNSNDALAKLTNTPVILVLDARGMTRGIAPLILGYQAFDPEIRIAGVVLNQLGGSRHESKLRSVIEHYTDVPVLGAVHHDRSLAIVERHLGLMPSNENREADLLIEGIRDAICRQVDLERLVEVSNTEPLAYQPTPVHRPDDLDIVRIGIARDQAFGFYYAGDLEALQNAGAHLVTIDTLHDRELPPLDGLFIGGGFPETHMSALEANVRMRQGIRHAIDNGLPVYAECGGLMYLARTLSWNGRTCEMVGAIPGDIVMHNRPQGRGYVRLQETGDSIWPDTGLADHRQREIAAHEFHYSSLENLSGPQRYAYRVIRGRGIDGDHDGIMYRNLVANYTHLRDTEQNHWAARFIQFVQSKRQDYQHSN